MDGQNVVDVEAEFARHTVMGLPRIANHHSIGSETMVNYGSPLGLSIILEHFSIMKAGIIV
jgi:hypothetical protein